MPQGPAIRRPMSLADLLREQQRQAAAPVERRPLPATLPPRPGWRGVVDRGLEIGGDLLGGGHGPDRSVVALGAAGGR